MNIYQRIAAVQKECGYIKKDTEVGFVNNKYKGTSHDGVSNDTININMSTRYYLPAQGISASTVLEYR